MTRDKKGRFVRPERTTADHIAALDVWPELPQFALDALSTLANCGDLAARDALIRRGHVALH